MYNSQLYSEASNCINDCSECNVYVPFGDQVFLLSLAIVHLLHGSLTTQTEKENTLLVMDSRVLIASVH